MKKLLIFGLVTGEGGIQTHLHWLAKMLEEAQIDALFLSKSIFEHQEDSHSSVKFVAYESNGKVAQHRVVSAIQNIANIKDIIDDFQPDIYLAVGTGFYSVLPLYFASHQPHKIFHEVMSGLKSGWKDPRWLVRWSFDEVIAHTPTVASNFATCFGWKKEIPILSAIPSPLELTTLLPKPIHRSVPLGHAKAALFSRLVPHKGAFWLVQQWEFLKDVLSELHIHGSGPDEPLIRDYIAAKGIGDRVKCFGRYPDGQAYVDLLSSYDITLLPTLGDEGAPLVLLESIACGIPFVTYGVGGIVDYGRDNPHVLIIPPAHNINQFNPLNSTLESSANHSFIAGVKNMLLRLHEGKIDQVDLQRKYFDRYSYAVLKQSWISYLCSDQNFNKNQ